MKLRRFGRTEMQVSELAFGGGRSGGILINADDDTRRAAVRRALDLGINWFDTAPQYGDGKSEEALGWLLAEVPEAPFVSTKVRIDITSSESLVSQVDRSVTESLGRLKRDQVDLLQIHSLIMPEASGRTISADHVLRVGGTADAMEKLRDQGMTRFLGLTALGNNKATIEAIKSGRFDAAQIYYNLINPSSAWDSVMSSWSSYDGSGIMAACRDQDMAVMAIRIFAASYLATPKRTGRESILTANTEVETEIRNAEAVFMTLGEEHGSRAQMAVQFALSNETVSTAIVGLSESAHLDEAMTGADRGPLNDDVMAKLEQLYKSGFE
jgi:D-threo-aldose 1-dehydrogenase